MASEMLIEITEDEKEWARQLSREKAELDMQDFRATARKEARLEMARNLKINGVSIDIIAMSSGLTPEEVAEL